MTLSFHQKILPSLTNDLLSSFDADKLAYLQSLKDGKKHMALIKTTLR